MTNETKNQLYTVLAVRDIVVFPGSVVPLFVGRKQSLKAIEHAMSHGDVDLLCIVQKDADKEKIEQVIINLIENSIKYGKENGTTEIVVQDLVENKIIVRVTDNGIGVEKDHLDRLFERFYRVDQSGSRSSGGSGLGLAIVKHIVDAHDEKIYVESDFGLGSEFSFTIDKSK